MGIEDAHTYGYIRGTEGVDGDHIDVFLSDTPEKGNVFVVDQYEPDGTFDEHKVMYGFPDAEAARSAYLSNYEKGWENTRRIDVTGVTKEDFKKWIQSSHRKTKAFADYRSVKALTEDADQTRFHTGDSQAEAWDRDKKPSGGIRSMAVYDAARGLVEAAGIGVVEVDDAAAQAMLHGHEKTPVAGQPNHANEKPTSGSVLLSISGNSSSNRAASKEADERTPVAGQPNRVNEKPTSRSVLLSVQGDSSSRVRIPSKAGAKIKQNT